MSSSDYDNAGRISRRAFVVSTLVLLAVGLISACCRFYIRIRVQKRVFIDDAFLLFGICCLISAEVIAFTFFDNMYLSEALIFGYVPPTLIITPDILKRSWDYQKMAAVSLILTWCCIGSVKFSFLFLFRKLIRHIRPFMIYWWIVTVFNLAVVGYGAAVYIVACPYFYSFRSRPGSLPTIRYSVSQMVLDIVGDILILLIPVRIIWQIQVRWTQKLALSFSLCLTILIIVVTVIRASGIRYEGKLDSVWETYWQFISAEVGVIMTSATAFRSLFRSSSNERVQHSPRAGSQWYQKVQKRLRSTFAYRLWPSKSSGNSAKLPKTSRDVELPQIPGGTLKGIRTFIARLGRTTMGPSQMMQSTLVEEDEDAYPLSDKERHARIIRVQHDISQTAGSTWDDEAPNRHYS